MKLTEILAEAIGEKIFPGAVVGICTPDKFEVIPAGSLTYETPSQRVHQGTLYDIASITKTIPTAYLIWKYLEFGALALEQPVQELLPEWQGKYKEQVRLWHLLTHAVRYESRSLASLSRLGAQALEQRIWQLELTEPPGNSYYYVNTNSILLGWILERITGKNLQDLSQEYFWRPLGMHSTTFFPTTTELGQIAPTERQANGVLLHGKVHDESAAVLSADGRAVGSAGLFSSVPDLLCFLQMLLRQEKSVLQPDTIQQSFQTRQLITGQPVGLGWEYNNLEWMGNLGSDCFGKTGFTGCFCAILPSAELGVVMLSNAVHPKRYSSRESLDKLRQRVLAAACQHVFSPNQ